MVSPPCTSTRGAKCPPISGNPGALYIPARPSPPPVQARKGAGQIRNLFQFAMLFEKSKEKSKIRTWYHKSFLSTSRLSELGGRGKGQREVALRIPHEKPQAVLVDVILKPQLQRFPMGALECLQKQQVSFHCSHQCTKGLKFQSPTFQ